MKNKAWEIVKEREQIIASQRDYEIFINSLLNPPKANGELLSAKNDYDKIISK